MSLFGGRRGRRDRRFIDAGWASAVGGRADNQDRCAASPRWAVVSDGAGGHTGGARAAELTVSTVVAALEGRRRPLDAGELATVVGWANRAVGDGRRREPGLSSMAATVTVAVALAVAAGESRWLVANVGDSPAWRVTATGAERLTNEHNVAAELVRAGLLSEEEARSHPGRHRITRAVGGAEDVHPDLRAVTVGAGDALVLASDGLEVLDPVELAAVVRSGRRAGEVAAALVDAAVARQAPDNVTAVVLRHLPSAHDEPRHPR